MGTQEVEELKEAFNITMEDRIGLVRQIRVLLNAMDPRERYLPILPNSGSRLIPIKHAMLHNNFVMSNIEVLDMDANTSWEHTRKFHKIFICRGQIVKHKYVRPQRHMLQLNYYE